MMWFEDNTRRVRFEKYKPLGFKGETYLDVADIISRYAQVQINSANYANYVVCSPEVANILIQSFKVFTF
jgi:hypothetical protein